MSWSPVGRGGRRCAADVASIEIVAPAAGTNSVEHAYPDTAGPVRAEGSLVGPGRIRMSVIDEGRRRPARFVVPSGSPARHALSDLDRVVGATEA